METENKKEREARKKRAEKQLAKIGYVSLKNRVSRARIVLSMEASSGNENTVCKLLKCTHREFKVLLQSDSELGKLWTEIRQAVVSQAEGTMATLLNSKSEQMQFQVAKYILDRRHPDYKQQTPGQEITIKDDGVSIKSIFGLPED